MKKKFIDYYMQLAEITGQLSNAVRLKVGSVVVRGNQILATGYNGTPGGWDNNCEDRIYPDKQMGDFEQHYDEFDAMFPNIDESGIRYRLKTKPEVLHSEANALTKIARSTESSDGATLFCTHAPCMECAKLIYQSGINSVYYRETYRDTSGVEFLEKSGVSVQRYNP